MIFIVIAHVPGNSWALWTPSRFGFSDATEIFVFCSGAATALAFGVTFRERGWAMGAAQIIGRVWKVYWAHIATFVVIASLMAALNLSGYFSKDYVAQLNLRFFFNDPLVNLPAFLTLTYVPNYFDILPLYLVLLAMVPLVIALARIHPAFVALALFALWLAAGTGQLAFPAEPWSQRKWFFNPFGWQILFFTGFAFAAGWLPAPHFNRALLILAIAVVLLAIPFAHFRALRAVPALQEIADSIRFLTAKTPFGLLRYVHFLALAYIAWCWAGAESHRLHRQDFWSLPITLVNRIGQQSLAVFVCGMVLSRLMGVALDVGGRGFLMTSAVNIAGIAIVVAIAYVTGWFKSNPWRAKTLAPKILESAEAAEQAESSIQPRRLVR